MLAQGVPMLLAGDELGRTQGGNNNAYCQDNEISWCPWDLDARAERLLAFTRRLIHLRRSHPVFRRRRFFQGRAIHGSFLADVGWFAPDGREMTEEEWVSGHVRCLGMFLNGDATTSCAIARRPSRSGRRCSGISRWEATAWRARAATSTRAPTTASRIRWTPTSGTSIRQRADIFITMASGDKGGPNYTLTTGDFPFHQLADPADRESAVLHSTRTTSSRRLACSARSFDASVLPATRRSRRSPDPMFNVGGVADAARRAAKHADRDQCGAQFPELLGRARQRHLQRREPRSGRAIRAHTSGCRRLGGGQVRRRDRDRDPGADANALRQRGLAGGRTGR